MKYDIIIPVAFRDYTFLKNTIKYIEEFLDPEQIYIITHLNMSCCIPSKIKKDNRCIILDEDKILPNLSLKNIEEILRKHKSIYLNTGWYFQQFLKMGFAMSEYCNKEYYLTWDADTLPLCPINFFSQNNHPFFSMKSEHHEPYFETLNNILGIEMTNKCSYIAEHMMFNKSIMQELIEKINGNQTLYGKTWFEKIIYSTNPKEQNSFSEFETYGNYCLTNYPDLYVERLLPSFRGGGYITGRFINKRILNELKADLFTISFEIYNVPSFPWNIAHWWYIKYIKYFKYKEYVIKKKFKIT
jgi:hypothetical protein